MKINGIAHIALNVSCIKRSLKFYSKILPAMGLNLIHNSKKSFYYVGGKTGILIQQVEKKDKKKLINFSQKNIGLHHLCFRMRNKESINNLYQLLLKTNTTIIRGPLEGAWVPGYYYLVFEDPDNIRLEANYVPKKGIFEKNVKFNPSNDY